MHVSLSGKETLVVSDVHLGSPYTDIDGLRGCLRSLVPGILIIAGDLFDDEHRYVDREGFELLVARLLRALGIRPRVLIASLSSSSHDPLVGSYIGVVDGVEVKACNCPIWISGGINAVVLHGDMVVRNGVLAYALELAVPGIIGRSARKRLDAGRAWVVYGHSHVPLLDNRRMLLNPGPWKIYGVRRKRGFVALLGPNTVRRVCP